MILDESTKNHYKDLANQTWDKFEKSYTKRLKDLRNGKTSFKNNFSGHLSQKEVAYLLDIHPQNYNKIEAGKLNGGNNITVQHLVKLCVIYDCPANYILGIPLKGGLLLAAEPEVKYGNEKEELLKSQIKVLESALESEKQINKMLRDKYEGAK